MELAQMCLETNWETETANSFGEGSGGQCKFKQHKFSLNNMECAQFRQDAMCAYDCSSKHIHQLHSLVKFNFSPDSRNNTLFKLI